MTTARGKEAGLPQGAERRAPARALGKQNKELFERPREARASEGPSQEGRAESSAIAAGAQQIGGSARADPARSRKRPNTGHAHREGSCPPAQGGADTMKAPAEREALRTGNGRAGGSAPRQEEHARAWRVRALRARSEAARRCERGRGLERSEPSCDNLDRGRCQRRARRERGGSKRFLGPIPREEQDATIAATCVRDESTKTGRLLERSRYTPAAAKLARAHAGSPRERRSVWRAAACHGLAEVETPPRSPPARG